jgi:hypothetical protein
MATNQLTRTASAIAVGSHRHWARDFALIGGVTGLVAPMAVVPSIVSSGYLGAAAVVGALSGAFLGTAVPAALSRLGNVRLPVLLMGGLGVGAVWGGVVGAAAALAAEPALVALSVLLAGIAGTLQFGWIWLPYVLRKIRGKRTWPLVVTALAATPALGWASVWIFSMVASLFEVFAWTI